MSVFQMALLNRSLCCLLILLSLLVCFMRAGAGEPEWQLQRDLASDGIKVFYRTGEHGRIELRAETRMRTRLATLVAVFEDIEAMPLWVARLDAIEVLERPSRHAAVVRTLHRMPWPLSDREAIVQSRIVQDSSTGVVVISARTVGGYALTSKSVRVPNLWANWQFEPRADGWVDVVLEGGGNLGGSLSWRIALWLGRFFLWEGPYRTILGLKEQVATSKYQGREVPYIRESPP